MVVGDGTNLDFLHEHIRDQAEREERALVRMEEKMDSFETRVMGKLTDIELGFNKRMDDVESNSREIERKVEHHEGAFKAVMFLMTRGVAAMSAMLGFIKTWLPGKP